MNKRDIQEILSNTSSREFVSKYLLERVPYIFNDDYQKYIDWRYAVSSRLEIDPCEVCIVGSGAVGVSLNPNKDYKKFSKDSDIDVAIISEYHFNISWRAIRFTLPSDAVSKKELSALQIHKKYVFEGCIATDRILKFLPFSTIWHRAAIDISGIDPSEGREINFRIYKDFASLRHYHEKNTENLKRSM